MNLNSQDLSNPTRLTKRIASQAPNHFTCASRPTKPNRNKKSSLSTILSDIKTGWITLIIIALAAYLAKIL